MENFEPVAPLLEYLVEWKEPIGSLVEDAVEWKQPLRQGVDGLLEESLELVATLVEDGAVESKHSPFSHSACVYAISCNSLSCKITPYHVTHLSAWLCHAVCIVMQSLRATYHKAGRLRAPCMYG